MAVLRHGRSSGRIQSLRALPGFFAAFLLVLFLSPIVSFCDDDVSSMLVQEKADPVLHPRLLERTASLGEREGVYYSDTGVAIVPNSKTPNLFYIVSSITFAGVPIIKVPINTAVNSENCYNHNSLKRLMEEFISGKMPRLQ